MATLITKDAPTPAPNTDSANEAAVLDARALSLRHPGGAGIRDVSLSLQRGDVLGLLGLNGAGKSTTLRLLCGVLEPDAGEVTIEGLSLAEYPLPARARIGYLPDHPPVYDDLRVSEYLALAGRIRGLNRQQLRDGRQRVIEQCELGEVQHRLIGTLSKGYRQRVGLAQALIHEPAVILLDEPANGLDPQQMDSMRALIHELGRHSAVILSSHLLGEVTATCNRVAILHEGRLIADRAADEHDLAELFRKTVA